MSEEAPQPHKRRVRYPGKNPRRYEDKYKEHAPEKYPKTVAHVLASGKTPAGSHVPILVPEILEILEPVPGKIVVDCTLGYGGHAKELLERILPEGRLIGLDVDPVEQPRTEERMRSWGFGPDVCLIRRCNFAGLPRVLAAEGLNGADCILADLGVSSMQLDNPARGFSTKLAGPVDMRMNPAKGQPASELLRKMSADELANLLSENSDEPHAARIAERIAGRKYADTTDLAETVRWCLARLTPEEQDKSVRRVFQALRIAVNEEFTALDTLLRLIPECLNPGGRVAILTFHSGEDRRVKKAFQTALQEGRLSEISQYVIRAGPEETRANPRSTSAKLRWARK